MPHRLASVIGKAQDDFVDSLAGWRVVLVQAALARAGSGQASRRRPPRSTVNVGLLRVSALRSTGRCHSFKEMAAMVACDGSANLPGTLLRYSAIRFY